MDGSSRQDDLVPKKGSNVSSVVWKWFGFESSDVEQTFVKCKICRKSVSTGSGSTTNLFQHLRQRHQAEWEECSKLRDENKLSPSAKGPPKIAKRQISLAVSFSNSVPYDKKAPRWKEITDAVAFHIAKDMVPIYTIEKPGFIKMLQTADPRYKLLSRKYFKDVAFPRMYTETREKVAEQLEKASFFSTTTDLWSSRTLQPYMSLTAHYVDAEWKLRSFYLQTCYFPDDHTGEIIGHGLKDALASWKLVEDRQVCVTTDSGTNMIKAMKLNDWTHLKCFGHRLHNAIGKYD